MNDLLYAIGEALIDFIPQQAGVSFENVSGFSPKCGGAPANVCGAFARLGGKARIITQLGNDPFGRKITEELSGFGVDTSCISYTDKANTALAFVALEQGGNRTFSFYRKPSADMLLTKEDIREEWFDGCFALHFCSVSLGDFPMKSAHIRAIEYAKRAGGIISFDPNIRLMLWENSEKLKSVIWEFLPLCDIIKISDEELEFITGDTDIESALQKLFTGNVKAVVYTCGSGGAYCFINGGCKVFCKGEKVEAVDTTGAGDGFIGAFLFKLSQLGATPLNLPAISANDIYNCLLFANKFCGYSVQRQGAVSSYPNLSQMENIMRKENENDAV